MKNRQRGIKRAVSRLARESVSENYAENQARYNDKLVVLGDEIKNFCYRIAAMNKVHAAKMAAGKMTDAPCVYDLKYIVRALEDARDQLENADPVPVKVREGHSLREAALALAQRRRGLPPQTYGDNLPGRERDFMDVHVVDSPPEVDAEKIADANKAMVDASLRTSVAYRHNDSRIGDKTMPTVAREGIESLVELSKATLRSYANSAATSLKNTANTHGMADTTWRQSAGDLSHAGCKYTRAYYDLAKDSAKTAKKRHAGLNRAINKLANEEVENLDEISKDTLRRYVKKGDRSYDNLLGKSVQAYRSYDEVPTPSKKADAVRYGKKANRRAGYLNRADARLKND